MKLSVVIPMFNSASFIQDAVNSLLYQMSDNMEMIVVDDCSTDDSCKVVESINDKRIILVKNEKNIGAGMTANIGFRLAKGEYILRMDADDISARERIKSQVEFMDQNREFGVSSGYLLTFGNFNERWENPLTDSEIQAGLMFAPTLVQGAAIYRTKVIMENEIFYEANWPSFGEDWLLYLKLGKVTKMANIPSVLLHYRKHETNITNYDKELFLKNRKATYELLFEHFNLPKEYLDIHFYSRPFFVTAPTPRDVEKFRHWLDYLKEWNNFSGYCEQNVFNKVVESRWKRFFYSLPQFGKSNVYAYRKLNSGLSLRQWRYFITSAIPGRNKQNN